MAPAKRFVRQVSEGIGPPELHVSVAVQPEHRGRSGQPQGRWPARRRSWGGQSGARASGRSRAPGPCWPRHGRCRRPRDARCCTAAHARHEVHRGVGRSWRSWWRARSACKIVGREGFDGARPAVAHEDAAVEDPYRARDRVDVGECLAPLDAPVGAELEQRRLPFCRDEHEGLASGDCERPVVRDAAEEVAERGRAEEVPLRVEHPEAEHGSLARGDRGPAKGDDRAVPVADARLEAGAEQLGRQDAEARASGAGTRPCWSCSRSASGEAARRRARGRSWSRCSAGAARPGGRWCSWRGPTR